MGNKGPTSTAELLLLPGALALMAAPALWLAESWAHNPSGALTAAVWLGLLLVAVLSGPAPAQAASARRRTALLLVGAATVRLVARLLQIESVGALVLVVDALAVGRLLRLDQRPWPLSAGWMAALFAATLPAEAILGRLVGWPLRVLAAEATAALVGAARQGTAILSGDLTLNVDAPCSGVQGLMMLGVGAVLLLTVRRGPPLRALLLAAGGALGANILRLLLLLGALRAGLPALDEPLHSALGVAALSAGALPLLLAARRWPRRATHTPRASAAAGTPLSPRLAGGLSLLAVGAALLPLPRLETGEMPTHALPASMGAWISAPLPLLPTERRVFVRLGAEVDKRHYSAPGGAGRTVMMVRAATPLRMHDPTICLLGDGWTVERLGERDGASLWKATTPDGQPHLAVISFIRPDRGERFSTVSEALWAWTRAPGGGGWLMLEQLHPWQACATDLCAPFDDQLRHTLEI